MAGLIYTLCAFTAFLCAWLLTKAYYVSNYRLLLWGAICFSGTTLSNILLVIDKIFTADTIDLSLWRYLVTLASLLILLYGLIWETE
jgi:hypothetical protein